MRLWPWTNPAKPVLTEQNYEQYNAYSQLLDRNGQWIGIADTKAGVILGFLIAVFPVLAAPALLLAQKILRGMLHFTNFWTYLPVIGLLVLLLFFLIGAAITLFHILMTLIPRLTRQGKPSLIFFSDIAQQEYGQWQQHLLTLDSQMLVLQVLEQIHVTAHIANQKHKHVRKAIRALILTIASGLLLYILSQLISP